MDNDYETPMKGNTELGDGQSTIAHGLSRTKQKELIESKFHRNGQSRNRQDQQNEDEANLDKIQEAIQETGRQLENLHYEMQKHSDKYSEEYLEMEGRRNQLRKRIIDLDYEHKSAFARRMQQSRLQEAEEKQKIRQQYEEKERIKRQEREERELKRKQQLERYEQEYRERIKKIYAKEENKQSAEEGQEGSEQQQRVGQQESGQQSENRQEPNKQSGLEDELARSRRRLRIAEIETQLAESQLRRSRISALNMELDYLRYTYVDPYYVYRPYSLPTYYYPYSAYPLYSRWWLY